MRHRPPLLLLLLLALPACFQLREPEPAIATSEWLQPTQIDILLANFVAAVQRLNPANYERVFSGSDYRFTPDPTSAGSASAVFTNWSTPDELTYFNGLRRRSAPGTANSLVFSDRTDNFFTADSAEVSARYVLRIAQQDTAFRPAQVQGNIRLVVRRRSNEWRIVRWRDQRTSAAPCWTDVKKYFVR